MPRTTNPDTDPDTRYLELADQIDGVVAAMERALDDDEIAALLTSLAAAAVELVSVSHIVHRGWDPGEHAAIGEDIDNAAAARLVADLAIARHRDRPRSPGLIGAIEARPYEQAVLTQMATAVAEQPGWLYAHRLNILVDALEDTGRHTGLLQRLAHAVSHRPDGENALDHELADRPQHDHPLHLAA
ncbi:hypothetical protein AB0F91_39870 [Amycolatopsis sp. NPDC023774]|uniref:hypothetical protein n=1 Tax=Amycolatopsis sp. NPDC023774 TaxID=3155015 RepID=UPI0033D799B2